MQWLSSAVLEYLLFSCMDLLIVIFSLFFCFDMDYCIHMPCNTYFVTGNNIGAIGVSIGINLNASLTSEPREKAIRFWKLEDLLYLYIIYYYAQYSHSHDIRLQWRKPRITKFTRGPTVFHHTMKNEKVEFNPEMNAAGHVPEYWPLLSRHFRGNSSL